MAPPLHSYSSVHCIADIDHATKEDLQKIIETFPVIDNHAHNMLLEDHAYGSSDNPFESITSEAQGHALHDFVHSALAHMRGIKQLAQLYQCPATVHDVKAARYEWVRRDYPGLINKCLEGTHAIMMDDGLAPQLIHPFKWHEQFVPRVSRIVRIEAVAAELLEQLAMSSGFLKPGMDADWGKDQTEAFFTRFNTSFRNQIRGLSNDPNVRGFKSVVCYRTGLDVGLESRKSLRPKPSLTESSLLTAFHEFLQTAVRQSNYRVENKEVNDYLVVTVCEVLNKRVESEGEGLPLQFHTGLGDTDIDLVRSNPAYLQPLIEEFPNVDVVLLHSAYPYTREAGYLAANFANAWLDIGEVFPMLSRDGQESVLRQALELTPSSKILWSTDGHFFPETYYLANIQIRATLQKILGDYVSAEDITAGQAIDMAVDILFWNSNTLYKLDEERQSPILLEACGRSSGESMRTLINGSTRSFATNESTIRTSNSHGEDPARSNGPETLSHPNQSSQAQLSSELLRRETQSQTTSHGLSAFDRFLQQNPHVKYIWLQFVDYTATSRVRMVTVAQFKKQLASGKNPGITMGLMGLLQDDFMRPGASVAGQFLLKPDLSTLTLNKVIPSPSATVENWWMEDTDAVPNKTHLNGCPRWMLQRQVDDLQKEYNINIMMGFEVEICFMVPLLNDDKNDYVDFRPPHMVHSWTNMTYQQLDMLPMIEEIVDTLAEIDIHLPQFHSEAAPGQWEFPLPASEPLKAVDSLYQARHIIRCVAKKYGLKATLYPRPYAEAPGSASHTHFSVNGPGDTVEKYGDMFLAGVLAHLPAILSLTLPIDESYERIQAGIWAGGVYVTWGTQNREVPLRKCGPAHWELKTVDGIANMYVAMAALLASGLHGLRRELVLEHGDCTMDASTLTDKERAELGITTRLPNSLEKSLSALASDQVMRDMLDTKFVDDYLALKKAEKEKLDAMGDQMRRVWLMSRY